MPLNWTLKHGEEGKFYVMAVLSQQKQNKRNEIFYERFQTKTWSQEDVRHCTFNSTCSIQNITIKRAGLTHHRNTHRQRQGSPRTRQPPRAARAAANRGNCTISFVLQVTRSPMGHGPQAPPAHVRVGLMTLPRGNRWTDDLGVWAQGWSDSHSSYMGRGEARITGFPTRARLLVITGGLSAGE